MSTNPVQSSDPVADEALFNFTPMCLDLTGECARRHLSRLRRTGGDSVQQDLATGRVVGGTELLHGSVIRRDRER